MFKKNQEKGQDALRLAKIFLEAIKARDKI